jgi:hypothetical protein
MRTLSDAELHELWVMVQTEFLNRPAQQDGFAVEVVSEEEAALLGRYRRLPPTQRERLQTIASGRVNILWKSTSTVCDDGGYIRMQVQQYYVGGGYQLGASTTMAVPTAPAATATGMPAQATASAINTRVVPTATAGPSGTGSNRSDDSFMRATMFAGDSGQSNPPRSTLSLATGYWLLATDDWRLASDGQG